MYYNLSRSMGLGGQASLIVVIVLWLENPAFTILEQFIM